MWVKIKDGTIIDLTSKSVLATNDGDVVIADFQVNHYKAGSYRNRLIAERVVTDIFDAIEAGRKTFIMPVFNEKGKLEREGE